MPGPAHGRRQQQAPAVRQQDLPLPAKMASMTSVISTSTRELTINRGDHVLITRTGGAIEPGGEEGFYVRDTRLLSAYALEIDGRPAEPIQDVAVRFYSARHVLLGRPDGSTARRPPLVITVARSIAGAVHEEIDVLNTGRDRVRSELGVRLAADFADMFEVRGLRVAVPARRPEATWSDDPQELRLAYRNGTFERGLRIRCERADAPGTWRDGCLVFPLELAPHARWHACLTWEPLAVPGETEEVPACGALTDQVPEADGQPLAGMQLEATNLVVQNAWDRAAWDMEAVRLALPSAPPAVVPAAGVPWFMTLFGRDSAVTSMQALAGYPELARGTLTALASLQATSDSAERDMEPGKVPHEVRHGEVAELGLLPFQPYYGTHDATPLYVILLAYLHHWTGQRSDLERLLPAAERAMRWIERFGDRDQDGFLEYATRSPHGFPNQGWKDADDAIPHADGSLAPLPIALCEHQGYAYDARLRLAEIYDALERPEDAARLRDAAEALYQRFNEAFWWEEEGTYVLGLDGEKRPIRSVASNAGHCLMSGIVPAERAPRVAARLLADDMWSGWGIRTLSAEHPAYDPFSYHTGSVWPHDNATIATGFAGYGLTDGVDRVARALFDAAALLPDHRLPELFAGLPREPGAPPAPYPGACVPQAWAASAVFRLVLLLCGLRARSDGRGSRLYLDPRLPDWLGELTLRNVRAGEGSLAFRAAGQWATVLHNSTGFAVERGPAPWHGRRDSSDG